MSVFYRPEWTCGRYNSENRVAIFYNLIEGLSYFFEEDSAEIIGAILSYKYNERIDLNSISASTNTNIDDLRDFLKELTNCNLLTSTATTKEGISLYRKNLSNWKRSNPIVRNVKLEEKLPFEVSTSEMEYVDRVGGITMAMFEVTYNCSERCIHCYNIGATRNEEEKSYRNLGDELTITDYKRLIDELYDEGLIRVTLTGGDPFSNKYAWDIIEYLSQKGIAFDIFTNGQRLIGLEEKLANYYPRVVAISLYSSDPIVHDYITRIEGSFERSISVADKLSNLSVPLNIKCCVMQPNFKTYRGVVQIAEKLGAYPQFEFNVIDSLDGDKCVSHYLRLKESQYKVTLRDDFNPLYVGKEVPDFGFHYKDPDSHGCGAGVNNLCVSPIGEVMPCCSFHLSFGNIKTQHIKDILKSPLLKEWRLSTLTEYEECGKKEECHYCNLCVGTGYSEHGDWKKASENNCYYARLRYEVAQSMKNNKDPLDGKSIDYWIENEPDYIAINIKRIKG